MDLSHAIQARRYPFGSRGIDPTSLESNTLALEARLSQLNIRTSRKLDSANQNEFNVASPGIINNTWTGFTINFWMKLNTLAVTEPLTGQWGPSSGQYWHLLALSSGALQFRVNTNTSGGNTIVTAAATVTTGAWYNFSLKFDLVTGAQSIKVNNVSKGTATHGAGESFVSSAYGFEIGQIQTLGPTNWADINVDNYGIFERALSDAEETQLWNGGAGTNYTNYIKNGLRHFWAMNGQDGEDEYDLHGGAHLVHGGTGDITLDDGKVLDFSRSVRDIGKARTYNGTTDKHAATGDQSILNLGDQDFTLVTHVNPDTVASGLGGIFSKFGGGSNRAWTLYRNTTSVTFQVSSDGGGAGATSLTVAGLTVGQWTPIIAVHDSVNDKIKLSLNRANFSELAHSGGAWEDCPTSMSIGHFQGGADYFDGLIDDTMIILKALSQAEANAIAGKSYEDIIALGICTEDEILVHYKLNETSGSAIDTKGLFNLTVSGGAPGSATGYAQEVSTVFDVTRVFDRSGNNNDFNQDTLADRVPYVKVTEETGYFDFPGISEFFKSVNGSAPWDSDSQGTIIAVMAHNTGNSTFAALSHGQDGAALNFEFQHRRSSDNYDVRAFRNGGADYISHQAVIPAVNEFGIYELHSDGSAYELVLNECDLRKETGGGGDNGDWFADYAGTPDMVTIGKRVSSSVFFKGKMKSLYIFNENMHADQARLSGILTWLKREWTPDYTKITEWGEIPTVLGSKISGLYYLPPASEWDKTAQNNGFVTYRTEDANLGPSMAIIDKNNNSKTNLFTMTAGASSGLTATEGSFTENVTINGSSGWLKFQPNSNAANHSINRSDVLMTGNVVQITGRLFLEGDVDGWILYQASSNPRFDYYNLGNGEILVDMIVYSRTSLWEIFASNDTNTNIDLSGGAMYWKDLKIDKLEGNHIAQENSGNMVTIGANDFLPFDGTDDNYKRNPTEDAGLADGELWMIFKRYTTGGITYAGWSTAASADDNISFFRSGGSMALRHRDTVDDDNIFTEVDAMTAVFGLVNYRMVASDYNIFQNQVDATQTGGSDSGDFISALGANPDTFAIGGVVKGGASYGKMDWKVGIKFKAGLTGFERLQLTRFLNEKYNLFTP